MPPRTCVRCGVDISRRDRRSRHCSPLCRDRDYEGAAIGTVRRCEHCADEFAPTKGTQRFCSRTCRSRADVVRNRAEYNRRNAERRSRERGAQVGERFIREDVFDRDGYICQLCLTPIDPTLTGRHPGAASIDHIDPLNRGGQHTWENVWTAHFACNATKRDEAVAVLPVPRSLLGV
jgi:5-methylcytosine-specific restriction endonuclease McrA